MWSYDIAREQSPSLDNLKSLCEKSLLAGYNAIGLYLEHQFRYPSLPYNHGGKCLDPEDIASLEREFPGLLIIPMINLLGHMEGFLRSSGFEHLSEEPFAGLQSCPCLLETAELAKKILNDTIKSFSSSIIHIGGDETAKLGSCPRCKSRIEAISRQSEGDPKATLYADYFQPLLSEVIAQGRVPAIWGDMLLQHPEAMAQIPKETIIFNWQYFEDPAPTHAELQSAGFSVVTCPAFLSYNAGWLHLKQSEQSIFNHLNVLAPKGAAGICITTWEAELFGTFETWIPALMWAGKLCSNPKSPAIEGSPIGSSIAKAYDSEFPNCGARWATLMGIELPKTCPSFEFSRIRSGVKCRFLLYSNPFLLWLRQKDLISPGGEDALKIANEAIEIAPNAAYRGVAEFTKLSIEFCQVAEAASHHYQQFEIGPCIHQLSICRQIFDALEKVALSTHVRFGGSEADIWRCRAARDHVEKVIKRVRDFGDGSLGYRPSFESLTHPKFMPYDQGAWWLVNSWANE